MRVKVKVDWGQVAGKRAERADSQEPAPPRSRAERRLWYVAIAREIEAGVRSGRFRSLADASRSCSVSRARMSQFTQYPTRPPATIRTLPAVY